MADQGNLNAANPARRRGLDPGTVVFLAAMVLLGIAVGVVALRRPTTVVTPGPRRHYLASPYQAQLLHRGQLHIQSNRAIGHAYPRDLARAYQRLGYEWVSITDVNTLTPVDQFSTPDIVPVAGTEAGFPFGHLLDFAVDAVPGTSSLQQNIDFVHSQAGAVILAHPRAQPAVTVDQAMALGGLDAIEIFDARAAHENPVTADATAMWDQMLSRGRHVYGVVGDDTIELTGPDSTLGKTSVDVQVPTLQPALILDAIRKGAFVDSLGVRILGVDTPTTDSIRVVTTDASTIDWIGHDGTLLATTQGGAGTYHVRWNEGYVRAVARRGDAALGLTQPIFVIP
jgi:hypothetical protein